jgi:eukaryotic-like serine/threonine-protein kinase
VATTDRSKPTEDAPPDLLPVIRKSGVLTDRQYSDVKAKVLNGEYPYDPKELAKRLVEDKILTEYQTRRFLANKPHGLTVARYVILDRIGSGSMGRVYKAQHQLMGRTVALKIIAPQIVTNTRVISRFQREMKLVGRLDHPNVVRAFDADQIGEVLYIVMEYVPGHSLGQLFRSRGPMPAQNVVNYASQAARGLAHAHAQAIVHRDVKPSNLLLNDESVIKVLDLGLGVLMEGDGDTAFATADGVAVGTIDYMSPEQACGKEVDGRSDLYSLGCAMYHLITGRLPFPGDSPVERLGKRISGRPVPILDVKPELPRVLVDVMDRLLASKPHERYQTADEAAEALASLAPRKSTKEKDHSRKAASPAPNVQPPPAPPPEPEYIEVRPEYPGWFRPLAELAERSSGGALTVLLVVAVSIFILGLFAGIFIRAAS